MVDAITSFNANKPDNPRKDLSINWNTLTVKEIEEYEDEGQEVPQYIKTWKEYIEHLSSVPDDVTYATYYDNNAANGNNLSSGTSELLAGLNPSSITQGEVYAKMCKDTITNVKQVTEQLDAIMKESDKVVSEAETRKEGICDRIQTFQSRVNDLKKNAKKNPLVLMEINDINQNVKNSTETGITTMDTYLLSVQNIGMQVNDTYDLLQGAGTLADTATSFNDYNLRSRMLTLKYSKELKNLAKEKKRDVKSAVDQQEGNEETVSGFSKDINKSAGNFTVAGTESASSSSDSATNSDGSTSAKTDAKNDEKAAENKKKKEKSSEKSKSEKSKTLADEKILTDPNEILKRKQKRGEA